MHLCAHVGFLMFPVWVIVFIFKNEPCSHLQNAIKPINNVQAVYQDVRQSQQETKQTIAKSFKLKLTDVVNVASFVDHSINNNRLV